MIPKRIMNLLYLNLVAILAAIGQINSSFYSHNIKFFQSLGPRPSENYLQQVGSRDQFKYVHSKLNSSSEYSTAKRKKAKYAPDLLLLTDYDPLRSSSVPIKTYSDRLTGSTVELSSTKYPGSNSFPKILKSSSEAIKLHHELLEEAPNDGLVRVRMYFHQAKHDDPRDYGTGPWKYWGHGWGYEYGFDPRDYDGKQFQRGYTIEKAFGRDFCQDHRNCRSEDPKFFKGARKYMPNIPSFIEDTEERILRLADNKPTSSRTPDEIMALMWRRIPIR